MDRAVCIRLCAVARVASRKPSDELIIIACLSEIAESETESITEKLLKKIRDDTDDNGDLNDADDDDDDDDDDDNDLDGYEDDDDDDLPFQHTHENTLMGLMKHKIVSN
ncbi:unnamed protein product [Echinostoma caproni]|uniref:Uncharacterized protein n=1 Tax=Echinostoma caproni TaxID=27848 RepID=A0A183ACF0_9TREM|nr:unnamed protein product [Echinostoma caproni]